MRAGAESPGQWVTMEGGGKAGEEGGWARSLGSQVLAAVRTCYAVGSVSGVSQHFSCVWAPQQEVAGAAPLGKTGWDSCRRLQGTPEPYV